MPFVKGYKSTLKGKTKYTDPTVAKRTETQLKQYASGEREGYWKNKKKSEEQCKVASEAQIKSYASGERKTTKGYTPWNKGLTVETDDRVRKNVDSILEGYASGKRIPNNRGKTKETSDSIARQSRTMKDKILNGEFTPKTENWKYKSEFVEDLGHYCRSSWEIEICRLLKRLGINYLYEDKRFKLGNSTIYIPDLYISDYNLIIEIKGYEGKNGENIEKFKLFKLQYPKYRTLLIGEKQYKKLIKSDIKSFNDFMRVCDETKQLTLT